MEPSGKRFLAAYEGDAPPWVIGHAQPVVRELVARGALRGRVLDVGCGTGENAVYVARHGATVTAIDYAPRAVEQARALAEREGVSITLAVGDALSLAGLPTDFDVALDTGVFHVFSDEERPRYRDAVAARLAPGGTLFVVCFSEREPAWGGPRRVTREELRSSLEGPFAWEGAEATRYENRMGSDGGAAHAWLATLRRL
ncbi:MAG: class I SAM-dependent methyltransferase [Polyangiales bacterium]